LIVTGIHAAANNCTHAGGLETSEGLWDQVILESLFSFRASIISFSYLGSAGKPLLSLKTTKKKEEKTNYFSVRALI